MEAVIHRGTKEIGGTLLELRTAGTRILIDAGYPLFLEGSPISDDVVKRPVEELLQLGVLPPISGLYAWEDSSFNGVVISHAHIDHYGLLKYIHPNIPVYLSPGTEQLIRLSQRFGIADSFERGYHPFVMFRPFQIGDITIKPYLMDHSAFDAAAFEITAEGKRVVYSGDFRGHGRKAVCLDRFLERIAIGADALFVEGSTLGRDEERLLTESQLEEETVRRMTGVDAPLLVQCSSQNIDRLVTFYRAAQRLKRLFVVDVYTANVLYELRQLGNNLPYPSAEYPDIKVFFPYRLTQKIFKEIGEEYARRFSEFHISRERLHDIQNRVVMTCRPSMGTDMMRCGLANGVFLYSLWNGYRSSPTQCRFEALLEEKGFAREMLHTSGHAAVSDICRVIERLNPKRVIPIHTLYPEQFHGFSNKVELMEDGVCFEI